MRKANRKGKVQKKKVNKVLVTGAKTKKTPNTHKLDRTNKSDNWNMSPNLILGYF